MSQKPEFYTEQPSSETCCKQNLDLRIWDYGCRIVRHFRCKSPWMHEAYVSRLCCSRMCLADIAVPQLSVLKNVQGSVYSLIAVTPSPLLSWAWQAMSPWLFAGYELMRAVLIQLHWNLEALQAQQLNKDETLPPQGRIGLVARIREGCPPRPANICRPRHFALKGLSVVWRILVVFF